MLEAVGLWNIGEESSRPGIELTKERLYRCCRQQGWRAGTIQVLQMLGMEPQDLVVCPLGSPFHSSLLGCECFFYGIVY